MLVCLCEITLLAWISWAVRLNIASKCLDILWQFPAYSQHFSLVSCLLTQCTNFITMRDPVFVLPKAANMLAHVGKHLRGGASPKLLCYFCFILAPQEKRLISKLHVFLFPYNIRVASNTLRRCSLKTYRVLEALLFEKLAFYLSSSCVALCIVDRRRALHDALSQFSHRLCTALSISRIHVI